MIGCIAFPHLELLNAKYLNEIQLQRKTKYLIAKSRISNVF